MSPAAQARLETKLEQHKEGSLDEAGQNELHEIQRLNHHLMLLKASVTKVT